MNHPQTSDSSPSRRIDLTHDTDVAFWCRVLDVSAEELRIAIQHVGPQTQAVLQYLKERERGCAAPRAPI